jgi:hypothetical protein
MSASVADLQALALRFDAEKKANDAKFDPLTSLGIDREEKIYNMRLLALTKPDDYAKLRAAAFLEMKTAVTASYTAANKSFVDAGYSADQAKGSALAAAEQTRQVQRMIIEQRFPSSANAIGDASTVREAGAFTGMAPGAAPRRSAPRKTTTRSAADRAKSARKGAATRRKNAKAKK